MMIKVNNIVHESLMVLTILFHWFVWHISLSKYLPMFYVVHYLKPLITTACCKVFSQVMLKLLISSFHKGTSKKNEFSNFRPVSILTNFRRIYEKVAKSFLETYMNKFLSPFLSANRKNCRTQHVLIRLFEEWREQLDNIYVVGSVFMGFSKALNCIPHDILITKLDAYGFNRNLVRYIHSYLEKKAVCSYK